MIREDVLARVAMVHGMLVLAVAFASTALGLSLRDVILGGAAMAMLYGALWGLGRALVRPERKLILAALGAFKVLSYAFLALVVLGGRWELDGAAFAAGVSCFVVATVAVAIGGGAIEARAEI